MNVNSMVFLEDFIFLSHNALSGHLFIYLLILL